MKKNTIKAFTLVEMLIVIVIIGILIASLMPRMQSAQGRARDVARKNDLSQIQTAIITSQQDKGKWPQLDGNGSGKYGMAIGSTSASPIQSSIDLVEDLQNAGMTQVPTDPNGSNVVVGLGVQNLEPGKYGYMVTTRNSIENGGFVLMAKTEVEGSSNWITCLSGRDSNTGQALTGYGIFKQGVDLKYVQTCSSFEKNATDCMISGGVCYYTDEGQLAYILVY